MIESSIKKADILIEALPYIRAFRDKVIVVKYGGSAMADDSILEGILEDVVFLNYVGVHTVVVHGGGPLITQRLKERGVVTRFVHGKRVTDAETMAVVEETLQEINGQLVSRLRALGAAAVGSREFGTLGVLKARPHSDADVLGFVGDVSRVSGGKLHRYLSRDRVPVIAPIGVGRSRELYNINGDDVARAIAVTLGAEKLVLLTNVRGILRKQDDESSLISHVLADEVAMLIERHIIEGGMIPKVHACTQAIGQGVRKAHIIDAKIQHAILLEIFTEQGIGTEIVR